MFAHAALLALSGEPYQYTESRGVEVTYASDLQSTVPAPERIPATMTATIQYIGVLGESRGEKNRLDAVSMMLPPLTGFPRASSVCFIAADACLTARKQLRQDGG